MKAIKNDIQCIWLDIHIGSKQHNDKDDGSYEVKYKPIATEHVEISFPFYEPEKMQTSYKDQTQELLRLSLVRLQQIVIELQERGLDTTIMIKS